IASWHGGRRPAVLEGESLQLAVARGAAYFGLARRGLGVRIGGGAARTYYLGLGDGRALCLVPRGMEEGEQRRVPEPGVEPPTDHRWRLEFRLREAVGEAAPTAEAAGLVIEPARVEEAGRLLAAAFAGGDDPVTLTRRLEAALGAGRDAWPLAAVRGLWDTLW